MCILFIHFIENITQTTFLIFHILLRFCPNDKIKIKIENYFNNVKKTNLLKYKLIWNEKYLN